MLKTMISKYREELEHYYKYANSGNLNGFKIEYFICIGVYVSSEKLKHRFAGFNPSTEFDNEDISLRRLRPASCHSSISLSYC